MVSDREVMQAMLTVKTYCDEHRFCKECRPAKMQGCPNIAGNAPYLCAACGNCQHLTPGRGERNYHKCVVRNELVFNTFDCDCKGELFTPKRGNNNDNREPI